MSEPVESELSKPKVHSYAEAVAKNTEREVWKEYGMRLLEEDTPILLEEKGKGEQDGNQEAEPALKIELDEKGIFNIIASEAEKIRPQKPWKLSLIVKLLGKRMGFMALKKKARVFDRFDALICY